MVRDALAVAPPITSRSTALQSSDITWRRKQASTAKRQGNSKSTGKKVLLTVLPLWFLSKASAAGTWHSMAHSALQAPACARPSESPPHPAKTSRQRSGRGGFSSWADEEEGGVEGRRWRDSKIFSIPSGSGEKPSFGQ